MEKKPLISTPPMSNKNKSGIIYSTNPDFSFVQKNTELSVSAQQQNLKISLARKHRAGKTVTIISGFVGSENDLYELAKKLKTKCGTGGSTKEKVIILQGDCRTKAAEILAGSGYNVKIL